MLIYDKMIDTMNERYQTLLSQVQAVVKDDLPLVTNLANTSSILFKMEDVNWAGFYLLLDNELVLGPFQGDVACTRIPLGKGVCGKSAEIRKTIVVDDVNLFDGHIACSSLSKSEIVVPLIKDEKLIGVIDIDSPIYSRFKKEEQEFLEQVRDVLVSLIK